MENKHSVAKDQRRGRGAVSNQAGRFEAFEKVGFDDGWAREEDRAPIRTEVRIERPRKIISRNSSPDLSFDRSINPYRGCEHGCIYCFARPSHGFLGMSAGLDFETKLIARPKAAEVLAEELSKPGYAPQAMAVGTNTDPYQPIEGKYRVMRECLEVLSAFNHPVTITTKGALIERDLDLLADMAERNLARVGITITTLDAGLSRKLEPRVPSPKRQLAIIERLARAGVPVRLMLSPVIPGLTDHEIEAILENAAEAGACSATWAMLRLPYEVSELFQEWLQEHVPGRAGKVMARVRELHGGKTYEASWGKRLRGEGVYANLIAQRVTKARKRYGLDRPPPALALDRFKVPQRVGDQLSLF